MVSKVQGKTVFGDARWAELSAHSAWRGPWMVAHAWLVIIAAASLAIAIPNPLTIGVAVLLIGSRQLGLAILMHDAAHGLLTRSTRWNDLIGQWLCAWPVGVDLQEYRAYHLKHHRFAQQAEDPDLKLSAPFPVTRASLLRKVVRDLTGLTFIKLRILPVLAAALGRRRMLRSEWAMLTTQCVFAALAVATDMLWVYLLLWLLPMATWNMLVTRLRNIAEHACMTNEPDPWRVARTTEAGWLARIFVAPYFVNYHAEHHLFMGVPCYRLAGVHRALAGAGLTTQHNMPVTGGYARVLREASGA